MTKSRRRFIKQVLLLLSAAGGMLTSGLSFAAWSAELFAEQKYKNTLKQLFGPQKLVPSKEIELKLPRIAENGAVVPITVSSTLPNVQNVYILVEKNPVPLAAQFTLSPNATAFVSARLKMAETCDVIAVLQSEGKLFSARKTVKVTIGGCGG